MENASGWVYVDELGNSHDIAIEYRIADDPEQMAADGDGDHRGDVQPGGAGDVPMGGGGMEWPGGGGL